MTTEQRFCQKCRKQFVPAPSQAVKYAKVRGIQCRDCKREYDRVWRERRLAAGLPAYGGLGDPEKKGIRMAAYRRRPDRQVAERERIKKRRLLPEEQPKIAARIAVKAALAAGSLVRQSCWCHAPADAHHPDYLKPLEVVWLCRKHHAAEHRRMRNA